MSISTVKNDKTLASLAFRLMDQVHIHDMKFEERK